MSILLCAATEFEIRPTIEFIKEKRISAIDVLITGVGLTAASYQLTKAVCIKKPSLLLQAGIAGTFNRSFTLGKVVAVENETIGDSGVEENGRFATVFELGLIDKNSFPWTDGRLRNSNDILRQLHLPVADSVTINEISTNPQKLEYYENKLGVAIESMEGAALHYVALLENIPFLQIRSLSNFVGERNKSAWKMSEAIASLNHELQKIILKLMNV
jgi:futalosine hydrolase